MFIFVALEEDKLVFHCPIKIILLRNISTSHVLVRFWVYHVHYVCFSSYCYHALLNSWKDYRLLLDVHYTCPMKVTLDYLRYNELKVRNKYYDASL